MRDADTVSIITRTILFTRFAPSGCYITSVDMPDASVRNDNPMWRSQTYTELHWRRLSRQCNWGLKISVPDARRTRRNKTEPNCISQIHPCPIHKNVSLIRWHLSNVYSKKICNQSVPHLIFNQFNTHTHT